MNLPTILMTCWIILFTIDFFIYWVLNILNINHVLKNRESIPGDLIESVTKESYQRSTSYTLRKAQFGLFHHIQNKTVMLFFAIFGIAGVLDSLFTRLPISAFWQGIAFLSAIFLILRIIRLPASLYSQLVIEEEFGFNTSRISTIFTDTLKGLIVGSLLLIVLMTALQGAIVWFPEWWWAVAWFFVTIFQWVITLAYPTIIAPLFNKFTPLEEGELKEQLDALSRRCKFSVSGIFVMDGSRRSRHSNAYFTGIGKFRRIVIYDTLIKILDHDELEAVLAHEIGHWKHGHIRRQLILGMLVNLGLFALVGLLLRWEPLFNAFGIREPSIHALVFIVSYFSDPLGTFFAPLFNSISRRHEFQADNFASKHIGDPEPMRRALLKLSKDNLSNLTPHPTYSFWNYSHPPLAERLSALTDGR